MVHEKILASKFGPLALALSCWLLSAASAFEMTPSGFSGSRSDFQMQQAQEAIRSICGCVVGNETLNPNCGPLTAANLQQQQPSNPAMGMMGISGAAAVGGHGGTLPTAQPQPALPNMPAGGGSPFFPGR